MTVAFRDRLQAVDPAFLTFDSLKTVQVNLGDLCNLKCRHCHVEASPGGTKVMPRDVMEKVVRFLECRPGLTLDITGGCPEMNPDFRFLIDRSEGKCSRRMVRSNLAILTEAGMEWLPAFLRERQVVIIGSLPCYMESNVDAQRGHGIFSRSIRALRTLNALGYGTEIELNLVYNPSGAFLPASQKKLEEAYREELLQNHGIVFNNLYTLTNAPIGRFRQVLEGCGEYSGYISLLAAKFNPDAASAVMCRSLVSVGPDGLLYNCDFNLALEMPITSPEGTPLTVDQIGDVKPGDVIAVSDHCYCCTAGAGSSCTGSLAA